jgi:hypothetical protein
MQIIAAEHVGVLPRLYWRHRTECVAAWSRAERVGDRETYATLSRCCGECLDRPAEEVPHA